MAAPQFCETSDEACTNTKLCFDDTVLFCAAQRLRLLAGDVADLQAGLEHAQDGVAVDHADDVFVGDYGHLVDVLALHALQDG